MRIGIGCTAFNRPDCLEQWKKQIAKHTSMDNVLIYIAEDMEQDRQGVARRKNECLRALQHCDYIFLFDDDCYPIKDNWINYFVDSKRDHLLFLSDKKHKLIGKYSDFSYYADCGGVFLFMTKKIIEKVGAFNQKFNIYGFEHAEYSQRCYSFKGITRGNYYEMLNNTSDYLFALDYSTNDHKSSISDEEKNFHVKNNWNKFFNEPINNIYLPL